MKTSAMWAGIVSGAAVQFVADGDERVFFDASQKIGPQGQPHLPQNGVISRAMPQGDILGLAQPLCLTREQPTSFSKTAYSVRSVFANL
ncbi:MAG: hypothetical protein E5Y51_23050 [Mesorhizobium sp.]|nr:MAG: hypothetical protein E5Y51_23050 [Mesorhizobium sp.]